MLVAQVALLIFLKACIFYKWGKVGIKHVKSVQRICMVKRLMLVSKGEASMIRMKLSRKIFFCEEDREPIGRE